jgi:hypothetical protein
MHSARPTRVFFVMSYFTKDLTPCGSTKFLVWSQVARMLFGLNGDVGNYFCNGRCVGQGDPPSSFLFDSRQVLSFRGPVAELECRALSVTFF